MKRILTLAILLLVTACAKQVPALPAPSPSPGATAASPTSPPLPALSSTPEPTATPLPPTPSPSATPLAALSLPIPTDVSLASVTSFAEFPNNLAKGETAPEFTARLLGGDTFTLSERRGDFLLVIPTAVGCGPCMFSLQEISQAYPSYKDGNLAVLILDIYEPDPPEVWQIYADIFAGLSFSWGVVDSFGFLVDYNVTGLGAILLIDPGGKIVFLRNYPLTVDDYQVLFGLMAQASNPTQGKSQ